MPEMYGTHHTKAIILFRHDDLAQIVILTANFIEQDFRMSQAIWRTPLLPLQKDSTFPRDSFPPLGSGPRFKHDLLAYFRGYSRNGIAKLPELVSQLKNYDFGSVRGALIGSLPGLQMPGQLKPEEQDRIGRWGLPALKRILSSVPTNSAFSSDPKQQPHIIVQVSSIASVGEKWLLKTLIPTLSTIKYPINLPQLPHPKTKTSIVFPTAASIRNSIDGYGSGGSIHIKTASTAQAKQLAILKPMLCHWSGPQPPDPALTNHHQPIRQANRGPAAPHIKTYVRFSSPSQQTIDWAMMTSANLSTQAWGGEVRISSYELGVVVWPALWDGVDAPGTMAIMVPVFEQDTPVCNNDDDDDEAGCGEAGNGTAENGEAGKNKAAKSKESSTIIGWRMPYDLPLVPYEPDEKPWCASEPCDEPDWMGRVWPGYRH